MSTSRKLIVVGEKEGLVAPEDYEKVRANIREDLEGYFASVGERIDAFYPEELYSGPYVKFAPDIGREPNR